MYICILRSIGVHIYIVYYVYYYLCLYIYIYSGDQQILAKAMADEQDTKRHDPSTPLPSPSVGLKAKDCMYKQTQVSNLKQMQRLPKTEVTKNNIFITSWESTEKDDSENHKPTHTSYD